jgi:[acyl-carrier-protein] S-malonyltransferase
MEKTAFLFTGQGAQYAGMGCNLYDKYDIFKNIFEKASEHLKIDLKHICSNESELAKTNNAQAAIFAVSYGIYILLKKQNIEPDFMAGFSLGEITSFAASEMLSFNDTLDLISMRGAAMQKACDYKPGIMYGVIGAEDKLVEEVCDHISKTTGYVIPANYNCPNQIVISGETAAVEKAVSIFNEKKLRTIKLNVAGAYHSRLMQYAQNELIDFLKHLNFNTPKITLYSNLTGKIFDYGNDIKSFMIDYIPKQMSNPVRFKNELENKSKSGCGTYIEIGAGRTLSGFVKKTLENAKFANIQDVQTFESALELFHVKQ